MKTRLAIASSIAMLLFGCHPSEPHSTSAAVPSSTEPSASQPIAEAAKGGPSEAEAVSALSQSPGVFLMRDGRPRGRVTGLSVTGWNRDALARAGSLGALRYLAICSPEIPDAGLRDVSALNGLRILALAGPTTDEGVRNLHPLGAVEELHFSSALVTDDVFPLVRQFPALRTLRFFNCKHVTDAGIEAFAGDTGFDVIRRMAPASVLPTITLEKRSR